MRGNEKHNYAAQYCEQEEGAHWTDAGCKACAYAALGLRLTFTSDSRYTGRTSLRRRRGENEIQSSDGGGIA